MLVTNLFPLRRGVVCVQLDLALTRNKSFKTVSARLRLLQDVNDVLPISVFYITCFFI